MSLLALALAALRERPLTTALNVVLLALGVGTLTALLLVGRQVEDRLSAGAQGVDFVVGAKGSPLQLILSSVYHIDSPTGNVPRAEVEALRANRAVAEVIPLALGDSYRGVRVVGTEPSFLAHYEAKLAEGRPWEAPGDVVVGARAARMVGLAVGDTLVSAHGLGADGLEHDEAPLVVVGVLAPGASVADGLLLTSVETVWAVHGLGVEPPDVGAERAEAETVGTPAMPPPPGTDAPAMPPAPAGPPGSDGRDYTAALVTVASPIAVALLPRQVNATTSMQAAVPAQEIQRLLRLLGVGLATLRAFGLALLAASLLGVFVALTTALQARRADLAVFRALGAHRRTLFGLVLLEGTLLTLAGLALGLALGHLGAELLGRLAPGEGATVPLTGWTWAPAELGLVAAVLGASGLASLLPALGAMRTPVADTLARA